ncbi:ABC transporter permease [Comamonas sp. JC664]|uniref:ABC transporter permease n=1 Tax=Comamonas sp. JC664 TaxID=2801917 RepID=UPI0017490324|nr:ABC transporter permease [Comamonas sp. JC664]MBL0696320.1 ABC transporter permease [Comamonas sp. JC664]GHG66467.1 sulfonate ABC transporter permease [Comamonas sp. KCTC 72670]
MGASRKTLETLLLPALTGGVLLAVWHAAVVLTKTHIFPSPWQVLLGIQELADQGRLVPYVLDSLNRVLTGYLLAVAVGLPGGLVLGLHAPAAHVAAPVIQLLRPISPLAWIPVSIILFGIANTATIFLIFLASLFPITLATMDAVRNVPAIYLRSGQNFGLGRYALLRRIILPAALPHALTGLRLSFGIAWLVVVAAEMIGVDSGLGYLIIDARNAGKRYDLVVAGILLVGGIGLSLDLLMRWLERARALRWAYQRDP